MKKVLALLIVISFLLISCNKPKNVIYVYNWTEYMPEDILNLFEVETGIKVIYSTYDSNELMYSRIKLEKGAGYDIIVPSSYYVSKMSKEGLLSPIDHAKLPNLKNLNPALLNQRYDPKNEYSIPYLWGSAILAYNEKYTAGMDITSWADLWRPEFKGYVLLNNDVREVFQMALNLLGYSGNTTDAKEIEDAYNKLTTLVPSVRVFNSDSPKLPFVNEEVRIGMLWNGELYQAQGINAHIKYAIPKEGAIAWVDCLSIPKGAKNVDNAHKFINFLLDAEIAKSIAAEVGYSTPNIAAIAKMDEDMMGNSLINPSEADMKTAEYQEDIGDTILLLERYWEKLKTD